MSGYIDKNKLLDLITEEDVLHIITELGSDYKKDAQGNICMSTRLCHGGDSPTKLVYYFNRENGRNEDRIKCYTCGATYDLIELVIRALRGQGYSMSYYKALRWIAKTTGKMDINGEFVPEKTSVDKSWLKRLLKAKEKNDEYAESPIINENVLDVFTNYPFQPWVEEGISCEAQTRFEIGYFALNHSVTIPHRDINGNLIGIRQRYLDQIDIEHIGKYTPVQIEGKFLSHRLGNELYGLWVNKDKIKETKTIILVEAEKSVLQAYSMYGEDSITVACCGSSITNTQQKIINNLGVHDVYYAPDRDYHDATSFEAEAWYNKQILKLKNLVKHCNVYLIADAEHELGYKQSPTDKGKDVFEKLLAERIQITEEEIAKVRE